jgi:hypothetical protein
MIDIDDDGAGVVEVWLETVGVRSRWNDGDRSDRQKFLLARGADRLAALIDAEKLLRDELDVVQARLHAIRHTSPRRRADTY